MKKKKQQTKHGGPLFARQEAGKRRLLGCRSPVGQQGRLLGLGEQAEERLMLIGPEGRGEALLS